MKASETLIEKIKEFEGFRARAYRCPAGVWTCGYGHTQGVTPKTVCTKDAADAWLRHDLVRFERFVMLCPEADSQFRFDAIVDFTYNLGCEAYRNSTLRRKILAKAPEKEIRAEFMKWVNGGGRRLPGLVRRRQWEADRFFRK